MINLKSPAVQAVGYLSVFLPPIILAAGWWLDHHYLLAAWFFLVLPFSRMVFGAAGHESPEYTDRQSLFLHYLPVLYAGVVVALVFLMPAAIARDQFTVLELLFLILSAIVAFGLVSAVSHTLIHQSNWQRAVGSMLSSVCAYPWLQCEHLSHHSRTRAVQSASSPARKEPALMFALRRLWFVPHASFTYRHSAVGLRLIRSRFECLYVQLGITMATLLFFTLVGGLNGFIIYGALIIGVPVLVSLVNYLQHWGLGDDLVELPPSVRQIAWDDDCQVLTWLTLGLNFHNHHHHNHAAAYFHHRSPAQSPRLPFSYGFAVLICLVPPLWRYFMEPQLRRWLANPASLQSNGNRLFCFSAPHHVRDAG